MLNDKRTTSAKSIRRLLYASAHGDIELLDLLLSRHASVDDKNPKGITALIRAARRGQIEAIKFLLGHGATIDAASYDGLTPLMAAAERGQDAVVIFLLDRGAAIDRPDTLRETAMLKAARQGHDNICGTLLNRGAATDVKARHETTPLIAATLRGFVDIVRMLLDSGADPNFRSGSGPSALIICGSQEIAELLLQHGAELNPPASVYHGWTPLMRAAGSGDTNLVRFYLERHAEVDRRMFTGRTALQLARECGHEKIISMLIRAGARE